MAEQEPTYGQSFVKRLKAFLDWRESLASTYEQAKNDPTYLRRYREEVAETEKAETALAQEIDDIVALCPEEMTLDQQAKAGEGSPC